MKYYKVNTIDTAMDGEPQEITFDMFVKLHNKYMERYKRGERPFNLGNTYEGWYQFVLPGQEPYGVALFTKYE
jgi:hypothetical protein